MSIPHWLQVYDKPKLGNTFLKRYPALAYQHSISATGGFDSASCQLPVSLKEAEWIYENLIGSRVAVIVDNPIEPCWEGFINRISFWSGGVLFTRSLDEMANRVRVRWKAFLTGGMSATNYFNNTDSQAIYGIKTASIEGYLAENSTTAASSGQMNALRDVIGAVQSWPQVSARQSDSPTLLSLELQGFYHTLEWEEYALSTGATINVGTMMKNVINAIANADVFFNNSDQTLMDGNTAFTLVEYTVTGQTAWQVLQKYQEMGDGTQKWVMGVTPTDYNRGDRRFFYRPANTIVEYTTRLSDGLRVRNLYGGLVRPWEVRPDRGIRLQDVLVGWDGLGDDPREIYIDNISYDADRQVTTWQGADDITLEGSMQLRKYYKKQGTRFGAPVRVTVS